MEIRDFLAYRSIRVPKPLQYAGVQMDICIFYYKFF